TARAEGGWERSVNYHHALPNAILPVVTVIGIEAAFLMGGLIVTETVFNVPGVARYLVTALTQRDYPIVQNLVMFVATIVVLINFVVDMLYAVLDRGIKYAESCGLGRERTMSTVDFDAELVKAGAGAHGRLARLRYLVWRNPLGAAGAAIMGLFVFAAVF